MEILNNIVGEKLENKFSGKFTFADNQIVKDMLANFKGDNLKEIEIDLSEVEFVDSAALGMFLLIKEETDRANMKLIIKNPQGQVKKMFELSRFYDLFQIH